ncbi:MAG TPA: hypothetical protein VL098_08445 [Flavipsychrobacter sp.]|nr:hypothetical protein [Flavipsychrobacter sp.]
MTTTEDLLQNPILQKLHSFFENRQDSLQQLKRSDPSDEMIRDYIADVFGIWGGGSMQPSGWYEYAGGKHPHLEIQDRHFNLVKRLEGKELINAFRLVYELPKGQQLSLF